MQAPKQSGKAVMDKRVVLVTGAGGAIGGAIAEAFSRNGDTVVLNDLDPARVSTRVQLLREAGADAQAVIADVADEPKVREMITECVETLGGLHVLVNCAALLGTTVYGNILEVPDGHWERILQVNLSGAYYCSRAALGHMVAARNGCIVNISSKSGLVAGEKIVAYASTKAGLIGLTRALALDFAAHGIRVNAIAPGWIESDQSQTWEHVIKPSYPKRIPLGRGQPEDVAAAAVFLASEGARYITGATLLVDGGDLTY
jgi:3-oxoacyl-[acyl-carrier protein] reductase